jgi:hypothetical protein
MEQIELLRFALDVLDRLQIPYALVGSFASGIWGEPRMTRDIDFVVQLRELHVPPLLEAFSQDEFYLSRRAIDEAIAEAGQFNVIHPASGNKIDFMVLATSAATPPQIARRVEVELTPDCSAYVAAPDDVIIAKLRYYQDGGSDKHLRDIAGILKRSGDLIDRDYVAGWAAKHDAAQIWAELQARAQADHG